MREFISHLKNILFGRYYFPGLILAFIIFFMTDGYMAGDMTISVFELLFMKGRDFINADFSCSYEFVIRNGLGDYASVFLPVVCVMPGIFVYTEYEDTGYCKFSEVRSGRQKCTITWLLAVMLSAGLMLGMSYALFAITLKAALPPVSAYASDQATEILSGTSEGYVCMRAAGYAVYGGFIAVISMWLVLLLRSRQLVLGILFTICYGYTAVIELVAKHFYTENDFENYARWIGYLPDDYLSFSGKTALEISAYLGIILLFAGAYVFAKYKGERAH